MTDQSTQLKPLAPLARTIAETVRDTPVRLGTPEGAADLVAQLTVKVAAYVGGELGPEAGIVGEIQAERDRQIAKWGDQHHPDGTGGSGAQYVADRYRSIVDEAFKADGPTWRDVLLEEVYEALAETDPTALRTELVQCAAVIQAWIADIDSRDAAEAPAA